MEPSTEAFEANRERGNHGISGHATAFAGFAVDESRDVLSFYDVERQILALYDHLNDLKLEIALWETHKTPPPMDELSLGEDPTSELKAAEKECLEARAAYLLRNSIVENVLVADPILKAVLSGVNATPAERSLHSLIDRRDILSIAHTNMATDLSSILKASTLVEVENIRTMAQNRGKAVTLLDLAGQTKVQRSNAVQESSLGNQLEKVRADTNTAKIRWRIMKSVTAAVIVGSGINWAANDELRDLVLDDEDEGE